MNSHSKCCDDYEPCYESHKKEQKSNTPVIVKCGSTGSVTIPLATVAGTTFNLSSLTMNTTGICNPCTKIEVTNNIIATAFTGSISFQVYKQCRNQFAPIPIGPAFTFSEAVAITASSTFTFFVCDCDSCDNECCVYTLVATVTTLTVGVLSINNSTLSGIAAGQINCNCCG